MQKDGIIFNLLNKIFSYFQEKTNWLWENSTFLQNIDNLIFATIIGVFVLSTFASSDMIGYVALITLFLTVIKLFLKKGETIELNPFEIFLLVYFLVVIISLAGSSLLHLSFKGFLKTFTYFGFYFSAVQYFKNNLSKIPFSIGVIALCAVSQGIIGLVQNFGQVGEISTWQDVTNLNPEDVMTRVYGTINPYNPNLLGGYLVASLTSLFGSAVIWFIDKKYKLAGLFLALALLTTYTLILTGCRGAYVGLVVISVGIFAFLAKFIWCDLVNKKEFFKKIYLSILASMVVFSTAVVLFVASIRTRVISIFAMRGDSSTSFRFNVYQSAFQMAKDNWLLGIGIGNQNFREIYGLYMKTGFDALSSYSVFLEMVVESGIFSLIAFLLFLFIFAKKALSFILSSRDLKSSVIVGVSLISVTAVMVHGLVDTIFFRPQVQFIFWSMVAFVSAVLKQEEVEKV